MRVRLWKYQRKEEILLDSEDKQQNHQPAAKIMGSSAPVAVRVN